MLIDIGFADWEQHCCGEDREVGTSSTFTIFHAPTFVSGEPDRRAYYATWHELSLGGREMVDVTGEIVGIRAVYHALMPHPMRPRVMTEDPSTRREIALQRVMSRVEYDELGEDAEAEADARWGLSEFIVTLQVPESTHLPAEFTDEETPVVLPVEVAVPDPCNRPDPCWCNSADQEEPVDEPWGFPDEWTTS